MENAGISLSHNQQQNDDAAERINFTNNPITLEETDLVSDRKRKRNPDDEPGTSTTALVHYGNCLLYTSRCV